MTGTIESVGIMGAGTVGASWASLFLAQGFDVVVYDPADTAEQAVRAYVAKAWPALQRLGLVRADSQERIHFHKQPEEAAARVQFIQESVPERPEIKHALYQRIEPVLQPGCIVASSTSGIMLSELQKGFKNPGPLLMAHPFNPPHLIPLVELMANDASDAEILERAEAFYGRCGKVTIRLKKEVPAHIANRLQAALWREAIHLVNEGVASLEDVDKAVTAGPALRWAVMGPHMIFNLGGGPNGFKAFAKQFAGPISGWWDSLGSPQLTPEVIATLADGLEEEANGRSYEQLCAERDEQILRILEARG